MRMLLISRYNTYRVQHLSLVDAYICQFNLLWFESYANQRGTEGREQENQTLRCKDLRLLLLYVQHDEYIVSHPPTSLHRSCLCLLQSTQQSPTYTKDSHMSVLPFDASSSNLVQVKASPWKGFASKLWQISLSAYQPQIYSALLRYSLRELGIIAEVMTVMMSLYLSHVRCPSSSQCLPLSLTFPYLSNSPHINIHFICCQFIQHRCL